MRKQIIKIKLNHVLCSDCKKKFRSHKEDLNHLIELESKFISDSYWVSCPICKCWKIVQKNKIP